MLSVSSIKISTRIYLLAIINLLFIVLIGGVALFQMNKIGLELVDIAEEDIPVSNALTKVTEHQLEQAVLFERGLGLALSAKLGFDQSIKLSKVTESFTKLSQKVEGEIKELEVMVEHASVNSHSDAAKQSFKTLLNTLKQIEVKHTEYDQKSTALLQAALDGHPAQALENAESIIRLEDEIDHELMAALDTVQQFTLEATLQAERDEILAQKIITVLFVVGLLTSLILSVLLARSVTRPVENMRDRLVELAEGDGDLGVRLRVKGKDETAEAAEAFNKLMTKLAGMVNTIRTTSETLVSRSENTITVMGATRDLVQQQKRETQNVADSVAEMAGSVEEVARSTEEAAALGKDVLTRVMSGADAARKSQDIIHALNSDVDNASEEIRSLAAETDRIGEVLGAIRGIAEQTNLLALNAAIEAARAGESGRGFAVVADEVRALSQRTQSSTEDIQELLENLQAETANAVATMQRGKENATVCIEHAETTASELTEVSRAMESMAALNTQIAAASEQQSQAAGDIHQNLATITSYATQTSDGANQTADESERISRELTGLHTLVSSLKS